MSISPNDIELTYRGQPINLNHAQREALLSSMQCAGRKNEAQQVVKNEPGCMDFNPHPTLKMNYDQFIDAEVGGGKPVKMEKWAGQPFYATVIQRNYDLGGIDVKIGDYLAKMTDTNGQARWVPFERDKFESQFVRLFKPDHREINEYAVPHDVTIERLEEENAFLKRIIKDVRAQNDITGVRLLELALEAVAFTERLTAGSEYLDEHVLQ